MQSGSKKGKKGKEGKKACLFTFLALLAFFAYHSPFNITGSLARSALSQSQQIQERSAIIRLGERLFKDDRFSTPKGDLPASCSNCHMFDQDPQGLRAYADFFNRSWVSSRAQDRRRLGLRNSPTIFDVAEAPRLHYDGEFGSLEELVKGTISGRPMGWLPGEESQAFERARGVILNDSGAEVYRNQFKAAFNVEVEKLSRDDVVELIAKAVSDFVRTLKTRKDSPYDKFIEANRLESKPAPGEDGKAFARRLLAGVNSLESKGALKLTRDFNATALKGLKLFFDTEAGNCATCHTPPLFTDFSFHNKGVSQLDYDRVHSDGDESKFAALPVPDASSARRPSTQLRENPSKEKPGEADLGFWNFVDLKTSPLRRAGESEDAFLRRMTATFKTPMLRNLAYTQPYFHNGSTTTLEDTLGEIIRLSDMARAGRVREGDEELAKIRIGAAGITPLVAFLNSLNDDLKRGY
ncbi:MAG TPA: cytochrome c peroxidase [Blastocatellia bacterium]|jgi:cytochrome c peroxidase|nr:cytochrome c peroxidase [Blastocatellia bacterium]